MKDLQSGDIQARHIQTRDGVSLAFHQQTGNAQSFLFQHGLGADHRQSFEACPPVDGWSWACLESRAHGHSDQGDPNQLSLACFADDIIQVIENELAPPIAIGGISMGAALSLRIAALRPDLVKALVLARPAWALAAAPQNMQPNLVVGELLGRYSCDKARAIFMLTDTYKLLERTAPDNLASLMAFFDRPDAVRFGQVLRAISNDGPGIQDSLLDNWPIPTLIMATPDDHVHPIELATSLAERLKACPVIQLAAKYNNKAAYLLDIRTHISTFLGKHIL